jgi:hypothetical protein
MSGKARKLKFGREKMWGNCAGIWNISKKSDNGRLVLNDGNEYVIYEIIMDIYVLYSTYKVTMAGK